MSPWISWGLRHQLSSLNVLITSANVIEPLLVRECGAGRNVLTAISPSEGWKGGTLILIHLLVEFSSWKDCGDELGAGKWHFNDHFRHFRLFIGHWRENTNCKMLIYVSMCKNHAHFVFQTPFFFFLSVQALDLICRFQYFHEYMLSLRIWSVVSGSRGKTVQRELYTPSYVNQCCYKALNSQR